MNRTCIKHLFFFLVFLSACKKDETPQEPVVELKSDKTLKSLVFKADKNPVLVHDVQGEIIGDTVYARAFAGTNITSLIPEFEYEGVGIKVGSLEQSSGVTANNFSNKLDYTVLAEDGTKKTYTVKFTDNGISALYINTNGAPINSKDVYVNGTIKIVSNFKDVAFDGKTEIKGRGNSTWNDMPKKPYRIKLEKKASLLGMGENRHWVLLANYADKTLMRNELAFTLSRNIGREFTPDSRWVEVYLNGDYRGTYQLVEQIKEDKYRVDVEDGGYLIEQDLFATGEPVYFYTAKRMPFVIKYPDEDEITTEQKEYIKTHFQKLEDAMYGDQYTDPQNGYRKYFDVDSYVDFYIVNEVIGNPDAFRSTYMYKKKDNDKIYVGPIWDFDKAANNDNRLGNQVNGLMADHAFEPKIWFKQLMTDRSFRQRIRSRWNELKPKIQAVPDLVPIIEKRLAVSQVRNFTKWDILKKQSYLEMYVSGWYTGDVKYLKDFLTNHIAWLDTKFNSNEYQ
ncbi:CotH kinase family protein [Pedobacter deserti]|uniref:CotH kinase family protein n=1 Tax=Pedobacter deserti TaxID=2817382 RepID=UPI00210AE2FD|nr:CotH kinase family protein [Pedobacter sp. SYSU D00382]